MDNGSTVGQQQVDVKSSRTPDVDDVQDTTGNRSNRAPVDCNQKAMEGGLVTSLYQSFIVCCPSLYFDFR